MNNSAPDSSTNHSPIYNDLHQKKRLSVRDIARKFDQGFTPPCKLSDQAVMVRLKEIESLEKHMLVKSLRDAMESFRGDVDDKNNDNVAMVDDAFTVDESAHKDKEEENEKIKDFIQGNIAGLSRIAIEDKHNLIEEKNVWVWVDYSD